MKKQFTNIYSLLGVRRDSETVVEESEKVLQECRDMYDNDMIEKNEMEAVEEAVSIIKDENKRREYNSKGHQKYVDENDSLLSQMKFIGGSDIYEDFYDLFNLERDAGSKSIQKQTAIRMKNMHPDKSGEESVTTEQFNTVKIAREVLTDDKKRELYNEKGHNKYAQDHIDADLRGFAFTDRGSITDVVKRQNELAETDVQDLIKFRSHSTQSDPTITATEEDSANPSSEGTTSSENNIADTVKKRKEKRGDKKTGEGRSSQNEDSEHLKGGSIIVSFLNTISSKGFLLVLSSVIMLGITYLLFVTMGSLGIGIGVIISLGVYLVILKKN